MNRLLRRNVNRHSSDVNKVAAGNAGIDASDFKNDQVIHLRFDVFIVLSSPAAVVIDTATHPTRIATRDAQVEPAGSTYCWQVSAPLHRDGEQLLPTWCGSCGNPLS